MPITVTLTVPPQQALCRDTAAPTGSKADPGNVMEAASLKRHDTLRNYHQT